MPPERTAQPATCAVCGQALTDLQLRSGDLCDNWRCRDRRRAEASRDFQARMAEALHEPACHTARVVRIPGGDTQLGPVPPEQRDALREHLDGLVQRLAHEPGGAAPAAAAAADTSDLPRAADVCGACGGHCCRLARDHHAFLDEAALRRLLAARPEFSAEALPDLYLAHLPAQHVEESCAFHGQSGCTLPREMRADLCNRYACEGLIEATAWLQQPGPRQVLLMNPVHGSQRRATLIGPGGTPTYTEPATDPQVLARTTIS